jgi:hypothetical protein
LGRKCFSWKPVAAKNALNSRLNKVADRRPLERIYLMTSSQTVDDKVTVRLDHPEPIRRSLPAKVPYLEDRLYLGMRNFLLKAGHVIGRFQNIFSTHFDLIW